MSDQLLDSATETHQKMIFRFFAVVPPGLERLAQMELEEIFAPQTIELHSGGLEWAGDIEQARRQQNQLRIPTRILVRVAEIPARDFVKWYKRCQKIPWSDFLQDGQGIAVDASRVSSHGSRLRIKKRIAKTLLEAFQKVRGKSTGRAEAQIWVRFLDDVATVSMDLGAGRLDRRSQGKWVGKAPMRENLVAAALYALSRAPTTKRPEARYLLDPMAGSGTALMEAGDGFGWSRTIGFENNPQALQALKQNLARTEAQIFPLTVSDPEVGQRLKDLNGAIDVFCNAPYGVRIKRRGGPQDPEKWYFWLVSEIERNINPDRLAIVLPGFVGRSRLDVKKLSQLNSLALFEVYRFKNGGIPVQLAILVRPSTLRNTLHQALDNTSFQEHEYGLQE